MAIATPLTYPSTVFEKCRSKKVTCELYAALGFHTDTFPTINHLHEAMHTRIGSLNAAIAAGGPYQEGKPVYRLYEGTEDFLEVDEDFSKQLEPGLMRLPSPVLIDLAQVLQFRYWPGLYESLPKSAVCSIIIMHAYQMKTDPQIQRFKAEYLIAPQEQQHEDAVADPPLQQPEDIVTAAPADIATAPTALLPGEP